MPINVVLNLRRTFPRKVRNRLFIPLALQSRYCSAVRLIIICITRLYIIGILVVLSKYVGRWCNVSSVPIICSSILSQWPVLVLAHPTRVIHYLPLVARFLAGHIDSWPEWIVILGLNLSSIGLLLVHVGCTNGQSVSSTLS